MSQQLERTKDPLWLESGPDKVRAPAVIGGHIIFRLSGCS